MNGMDRRVEYIDKYKGKDYIKMSICHLNVYECGFTDTKA